MQAVIPLTGSVFLKDLCCQRIKNVFAWLAYFSSPIIQFSQSLGIVLCCLQMSSLGYLVNSNIAVFFFFNKKAVVCSRYFIPNIIRKQYLFLASVKNAITNYSLHFWFFPPNKSLYCFQSLHHMTLTLDSLQKWVLEIFPSLFGQNFTNLIWTITCVIFYLFPICISIFFKALCFILSSQMWKMSELTSTCSGTEHWEFWLCKDTFFLATVSWEVNRYQATTEGSFPSSSTLLLYFPFLYCISMD